MNEKQREVQVRESVGVLAQLLRTLQLVWRLLFDPRVPILPKLIVPAALLYVLSPIDILPDLILGLGQIDDAAIVFFGIQLFLELCPPDIVAEHRRILAGTGNQAATPSEEVVEGTYRVVSDDASDDKSTQR